MNIQAFKSEPEYFKLFLRYGQLLNIYIYLYVCVCVCNIYTYNFLFFKLH